jgi:heme/copper-type cytochrome/quinol oxidase subunit 2
MLISVTLLAQGQPVEMADAMRSNGKIYVVLAVVLVIFAGIIIYLISIDRKVRRMENEQERK